MVVPVEVEFSWYRLQDRLNRRFPAINFRGFNWDSSTEGLA